MPYLELLPHTACWCAAILRRSEANIKIGNFGAVAETKRGQKVILLIHDYAVMCHVSWMGKDGESLQNHPLVHTTWACRKCCRWQASGPWRIINHDHTEWDSISPIITSRATIPTPKAIHWWGMGYSASYTSSLSRGNIPQHHKLVRSTT